MNGDFSWTADDGVGISITGGAVRGTAMPGDGFGAGDDSRAAMRRMVQTLVAEAARNDDRVSASTVARVLDGLPAGRRDAVMETLRDLAIEICDDQDAAVVDEPEAEADTDDEDTPAGGNVATVSDCDPVRGYLDSASRLPLLTQAGEAALSLRSEAARLTLLRAVSDFPAALDVLDAMFRSYMEGGGGSLAELLFFDNAAKMDAGATDADDDGGDDSDDDGAAPASATDAARAVVSEFLRARERVHTDRTVRGRRRLWEALHALPLQQRRQDDLVAELQRRGRKLTAAEGKAVASLLARGWARDDAIALVLAYDGSRPPTLPAHPSVRTAFDDLDAVLAELAGDTPAQFRSRLAVVVRAHKEGERARHELVQHNLRLVVKLARRYQNRGLQFLDLVQEGNIGLMRAAERFDHRKGFRFSTYASWWIKQALTRSVTDLGKTIRIPVHMADKVSKVRRMHARLEAELGRQPELAEVAAAVDMPPGKVREIMELVSEPLSLDMPVGEDGGSTLADVIEGSDGQDVFAAVAHNELVAELDRVLGELSEKEQVVLRMRFGFGAESDYTLEEVGAVYGVTRERIRQIEAKALRRLRHPSFTCALRTFLDRRS